MGLYRIVREDGSVEYTDVPSGAGRVESVKPGVQRTPEQQQEDHASAKTLIKEAQKRIPKIADYLDYIAYLRHHSPVRFDQVMQQLQREDPQTWLKLQKYPQFRPLRDTVVGLKAGTTTLGAGIGLATGNLTGSAERWMESTLKDLMKRDRFGPYADVLGAKATTLPTKNPTYSNSRLGQYLKVEDARAAGAAKAAAKDLEASRSALRAAKGTAVVRVGGTVLDLGIGMLNPETHSGVTNGYLRVKLDRLWGSGAIDEAQYEEARRLLSSGRYKELADYLQGAVR
jgi:hypothetical protein